MKIIRKILLLCSVFLFTLPLGAAAQATPILGTAGVAPFMPGHIAADMQRVPAYPFPEAVTAKVFVGTGMKISAKGDVSVTSINGSPLPGNPLEIPAPAYDSAVLTPEEPQQLKASIFFTLKPKYPMPDRCDTFRFNSGYTFYDAAGRYLGDLLICRWSSIAISPPPNNGSGLPVMDYDAKVQFAILQAHHLDAPGGTGSIDAGTQKIAAPVFPTATVVKAYIAEDLHVAVDGRVTSGSAVLPFLSALSVHQALLTKDEIKFVQNSVYFTQYPMAVSSCFDPNDHAFTFYDATGKYLGYFAFGGCGASELSPKPVNTTGLPTLNWDDTLLLQIFDAHHLHY